jgi:hypothetical protein
LTYTPQPIDTFAVELPPEIGELIEQLSAHNHDVWARQRLSDGWHYGPARNDERKEHPGLVPYDELTDSEKEYDRQTAREVLKAVLALGYRIERESEPSP